MEGRATGERAGEMDQDAARTVATLALTVDGGCRYCARDLLTKLSQRFPDHVGVFDELLAVTDVDEFT